MRKLFPVLLLILLVSLSAVSCIFQKAPKVTEPESLGTEWPKDHLPADLPLPAVNGLSASAYDDIVWVEFSMSAEAFLAYTQELTEAGFEGELIRVGKLPDSAFEDIDIKWKIQTMSVECTLESIQTIDEDRGWDAAYFAQKDENYLLIFRERDNCTLLSRPQPVTAEDYYLQRWY